MADWVRNRIQFIEKSRAKQDDGDSSYRIFPWQLVNADGVEYLEPVDYTTAGTVRSTEKEITDIQVIDPHSQFVAGNNGTGGDVGLLRS